jgi:hypothetical protein
VINSHISLECCNHNLLLFILNMKKQLLLTVIHTLFIFQMLSSQPFVSGNSQHGYFPLITDTVSVAIYTDVSDYFLVQKSASLLQADIKSITGKNIPVIHDPSSSPKNVIVIGTKEKSSFIKQLLQKKLLDINGINNRWEAYQLQSVNHPAKNIDHAVVIVGNDRRGAAFGVFELSKQIGVSPWYWWADVPFKKKKELYVKDNFLQIDFPRVKYRGIFLNDEAPALSGWAKEKFGGLNHIFYEKVFELILRLKANYLWPAMWGNAFNDDDTLNPILADKYGIVMGTSHHEPMLRAQQEWKRYGKGPWNYETNDSVLRNFWRKGIENMDSHESIVTVGMRGDGDKPMTEATAISLLERIVKDQRKIIEEVTHKPASETPQDWALYKEVQDYYDKGMRVPDDVALLLCDDNWGNIRRLPKLTDKSRRGGYGIYYHFDYVGDPRNYKWINTNNISRVWEQMHLAYSYGVNKIWIVNVGDLKPMELPINFFLDYAWNPNKWNEDNITNYFSHWAEEQFGKQFAMQIGGIVRKYSQLSAMTKPELVSPETLSLFHYNEADRTVEEFEKMLRDAEKINDQLPDEYKDAYFELVLHPVKALTNLYLLYTTVARNRVAAKYHQPNTNKLADKAKQLYVDDSLISVEYNKKIANGKWNHMMDQTHIGYTYWQQPPVNKMPEVIYLPKDSIEEENTLIRERDITAESRIPKNVRGNIFYEMNGYVSAEATHFTNAVNSNDIHWKVINDIGREGSGITTFPVTNALKKFEPANPHLEYDFYSYDSGSFRINSYFSPTLNFHNDPEGLQYAISVDDENPQIASINKEDNDKKIWEEWVANNIIIKTSSHKFLKPGKHIVKYWMISPAVVLQKLVIDFGGLKPSYLGPPETKLK